MTAAARLLGALVAGAAALALAAASAIPLRANPTPHAMLRVAFSARPERVESCRTLSADELADVPQHMRQRVVCEGTTARYRLEVRHDDTLLVSAELRGGGLRHDRQLYVLRELRVPSGRATVEVRLSRIDTAAAPASAAPSDGEPSREADQRRRRMADEVPATLVLRETVTLAPREVLLVTYDQGARRLRAVRSER